MNLLVKELKGYTFRLKDISSGEVYRAEKKFKLLVGSLLETTDEKIVGDLLTQFQIVSEVVGDATKPRVKVCIDEVKVGDLFEGVPVLSFGAAWAEKGKRVAYAYFK